MYQYIYSIYQYSRRQATSSSRLQAGGGQGREKMCTHTHSLTQNKKIKNHVCVRVCVCVCARVCERVCVVATQ